MAYATQPVVYNPGIDGEAGRIGDFYAPQWLVDRAGGIGNLTPNRYVFGGNTGWQVGNDYYAADQWKGDPIFGDSSTNPAYADNFIKYSLTPDQIAQLNAGNGEYLNGAPMQVLDRNGNLVSNGMWQNIKNNSSTDKWDAIVTALAGGVMGGVASGALSSGAAGAGAAEGGASAGVTGFGDAGTMYAGGTAADAATLGGGATVNGGAALGSSALGGTAAMGAGGAGSAGVTGFGDAGTMYAGADSTAAGSLGGGGSMSGASGFNWADLLGGSGSTGDWLKLATTLAGAYGGSKGQNASSTSTRTMDPRLDGPVYGQLVPTTQGLLAGTTPQAQLAGAQALSKGSGLLSQTEPTTATNPYLKGIADDMQLRTKDLLDQNNLSIQGNSVASGGLGGSRQGVAQGIAAGKAADFLQGNLANLYGNAYNQDQNRLRQDWTLGSGLLSQGVSLPFAPAQNAASVYSPFTGFGSTTNSASQGGGWMGALGGALGAAQYGKNAGWW